jgi:SdrD B-like domain/Secretion system C-terminal sorting domain
MLSIYKIYQALARIALIIALLCCNYIAFAQCDPAGTIISFSTTGNNTSAGFVTKYLLTDAAGIIIQQVNSPFAAPNTPANYKVYTINYDAATGTAPTLTAGTNIAAIGGTCVVTNTTPLGFTVCAPIQIQGTIFQDANGLTDATVNGTGTNVTGLLRANLLNAGIVVQSVLVAADGSFTFPNVAQNTIYTVVIATSATATTPNLPTGWVNTGENLGIAAGNDGNINGIQIVNVTTASVVEVDFGIELKPAALFLSAAPQLNPGGTTQVTLDPTTFGGTDPDGTIASLTLTVFPTNAASITVNGMTYTAATFPVGGITIPTNTTGQPTQTITADPNTGAVNVVFPYKTTDNAGFLGTSGSATFPFTLPPVLSITGTVFEDLNALTNNIVDGIGSNAGGLLYANLLSGGVVVQSVLLPANGTYTFPNVTPNTTYTVVLTTSATATTPAIPANYFNTGEGVLAAGDGTVNGLTTVSIATTTINNVNFGIRQTCEPPASTITFSNTGNNTAAGFVTKYLLTDASGLILQQVTNPFTLPSASGDYLLYTINYDGATGTAPTTTAGINIAAIGGTCVAVGAPLVITACPIQIAGNVFHDIAGLTDATVNGTGTNVTSLLFANLISSGGTVVQSVPVNADGSFAFPNVSASTTYTVVIATSATATTPNLPTGWANTGDHIGANPGSDATPNGVLTVTVGNTNIVDINFGIEQPPSANVFVELSQSNPGGIAQALVTGTSFSGSDPDGIVTNLIITNFPSNATSITVDGVNYTAATFPVGGITVPTSANGTPTQVITIDPIDGVTSVVIPYKTVDDAGLVSAVAGSVTVPFTLPLTVGNFVWLDANANGLQDDGATAGINGVTVELYRETSPGSGVFTLSQTTTTANNGTGNPGFYTFIIPNSANYYIKFPTTNGANNLTTPTATAATDGNSDADNTGKSPVFAMNSLGTGTALNNPTIDCGFAPSATVGNFVWLDANGDGLQNDGATSGINGVTVELYKETAPGSNIFTLSQTTITANDGTGNAGFYNFNIPTSGNYYIKFPTSNGANALTTANGTVATDGNSDVNIATGKTPVFAMSINGTGTAKNNPTLDAGYRPSATIGNFVWADANANGMNDEPPSAGINGLTIALWSAGTDGMSGTPDDAYVSSTITANDGAGNPGFYNFDVTTAGQYYVRFPVTNGTTVLTTPTIAPETDGNSDADVTTGYSPVFNIDPSATAFAKNNPTIDAAYAAPGTASAGNYVWTDTNANGLQDEPASAGINGVTVELWGETAPGSNIFVLAQTTTTASDGAGNPGFYNFTITSNKNYYIQFPTTNAGNTLTNAGATATATNDSNADIATGKTAVFAISTSGTGLTQHNPTLDAGYLPAPLGSLGDYVWLDANKDGIQNESGAGVSGIVVTLYNATTGAVVGATTTDAYGKYLFEQLPYGDYKVGFTLPAKYGWTTQSAGAATAATNSDVNPATNQTAAYTVNAVTPHLRDVDAGIYFIERKGSIGDYVWFDGDQNTSNGIQDASEQGLAGITVSLYRGGVLLYTTLTNADGRYDFYNLDPANDYQVRFTTPQGLIPVTQTNGTTTGSDMNPVTGFTPMITLAAGEARTDIDAGFRRPNDFALKGSIGDWVFRDLNNDGVQDNNEFGVPGITAELYSTDGTLIATTITDGYGIYTFNDLNPGGYRVKFSNLPTGYTIAPQNTAGNEDKDSDVNPTTGYSDVFTVAAGRHEPRVDMGIHNASLPTGSLGDFVWYDTNKDGIQDANEEPVVGIPVLLYQGATLLATTATDIEGTYLFANLPAGNYTIRFGLPDAYAMTTQNAAGSTSANNSDPDNTWTVSNIVLASGQNRDDIDAGIYRTAGTEGLASLGDRVWFDSNNDGIQNDSPPSGGAGGGAGAAGVTVTLYAADGTTVLRTTTTDVLGNYMFTGLNSGNYIVGFANLPAGYSLVSANSGANDAADSDANTASGKTGIIALSPGETNLSVDAGIFNASAPTASIGNFVWIDADKDNIQDICSPPLGGAGGGCEVGLAGITVQLLDAITGTILRTTMTDNTGFYLFPDLAAGTYVVQFKNLPDGYTFAAKGAGSATDSDADPATGKTNTITLTTGQHNTDIDAGVQTISRAALGDFVWEDSNFNGLQDAGEQPLAGVNVALYNAAGLLVDNAITDANGYYFFPNLLPNVYTVHFDAHNPSTKWTTRDAVSNTQEATDSDVNAAGITDAYSLLAGQVIPTIDAGINSASANIGNFVWFDNNQNGIQDATESGVAGVLIELRSAVTNEVVARTITDGDGYYAFFGVPADEYYVVFDRTSLPPFAAISTPNAPGATSDDDSNANPINGRSANITLSNGQTDNSIDLGVMMTASLGDFVWLDANQDGLQDVNEAPMADVTVNLYRASAPNIVIATMQTRPDGSYRFDNLAPDTYIVGFGAKTGFALTQNVVGTGDNSDAIVVGAIAFSGKTAPIVLAAGEHNPTIDAGYTPVGSVGNFVWLDANGDGLQNDSPPVGGAGGGPGINGVEVQLWDLGADAMLGGTGLDADTQVGATIQTANDPVTGNPGFYNFVITQSGNYFVQFPLFTGSSVLSPQTSNSATDGNSDANTITGQSPLFVIDVNGTGQAKNNTTIDAGFSTPKFETQLVFKKYDCTNNKAIVQVQVRSKAGNPDFYMNDANFRINYDAAHLTNPSIAAQENFSSMAPANDVFYDPQNLNGSVAGMVSLQIIAEGTGTAPKLVTNSWTTVSCLAFDIVNPTATSTLTWNNDTAFPPTGMNAAVLPSMAIFNVAAAGVFNNLTVAPLNTHLASLAITASSNSPVTSGAAINFNASTPAGGALPISFAWTSTTGFTSNAQNPTIAAALAADAGTYTVQVTDVNGCSATHAIVIVVNVPPAPAALGNRVWLDEGAGTNAHNGIQDADEVGVSGVTVTLYQCSPPSGGAGGGCVIVSSTKTDAYGNYLFANLVPNNYTVGFSLPINYVFSPKGTGTDSGTATDADVDNIATSANFGRSNIIALSAGETDLNVDAGIYFETPNTQRIGDFVWFDTDGNGVQNATEKGISGVTVTLYDVTGTNVIATTITDGEGKYLFRDLAVGSYTIGFGEVVGLALTSRTNFTADGSDADPLSRKTGIITLAAGENRTDIDAGMVLLAVEKCALGDKVWFDTNNDGIQNDSSPLGGAGGGCGVAGVVVQLYDAMNANIGTTVTDVFGNYLFNNLDAGRYYVMFDATTLPTGYTFVNENQGSDDANDSDCHNTGLGAGMTGWYSLAPGDKNLTIDAGIFNVVAPLGGLGNFVWLDANKDGIQNDLPSSGGIGFGGITVTLYAADGTTVVATTATDKTGFYAFNNLPQGDYVVGFSNLPQGYSLTTPNAATSTATNNSDANAGSGKTALITVGTTFRDDIDAGIYPNGSPSGTASLGDIVWYDTNNDGVQNTCYPPFGGAGGGCEVGVNNVTVNLLQYSPPLGGVGGGFTIIASQKTDGTGHYLFTGLAAGDYKVEFVTALLPAGYNFVTQNAGAATEATNSDVNTNTGFTDIITLSAGEDNLTIDAGIYKPNTTLGSIGNFVWNDLDGNGVQNTLLSGGSELGITGIAVRLLDATTGALVATTTTDRNGYYLFPDLPYGAYTVEFGNLPQGYVFTTPNTVANGGDDTNDSDADALTGKTATITINASTPNNSDADAGIRTTLRAGLGDYAWFDTDGDGIQNELLPSFGGAGGGLPGVLVTLYDAANPALRLAAAITDVSGYYSFLNLDPAVDYVVGFEKTPLGAKFTQRTLATADGSDADANTGLTPMVSLAPGEYNPRIDAGVTVQKAGLGDYVWLDANGDGIQNDLLPSFGGAGGGLSGVLVTLYDAVTNAVLAKAETDGTGYYSFSNLAPGTYYVGFDATTLPLGAIFTPQNAAGSTPENGSDVLPSTGKTGNITLVAGEFNANIDAGVQIVKAALGDFVWLDLDKNGIQNNDPTTGAAFEQPLANTKVYLFAAGNLTTPIDSTTTSANGSYWFMNLTPGDYVVGFGSSALYTRTTESGVLTGAQASETPVFNSDASVLTGKTGTITLGAGQRNATIDAGYYGTTLPVKLVYFKGNADACTVHLQWATASEQNAKSFEIWRSTDGINYTKIGTQKAAGNSTNMQFYTFTDTKPLRTNYYKLVQTDFDGKSETFALSAKIVTNGCFEDTDNGISGLYPNPNGVNTLNLKFYTDRSDREDISFVFYDVLGRAIATYPQTIVRGANHVQLDITTLPSGTYFVKAVGEGWYSVPQKLVRVQ